MIPLVYDTGVQVDDVLTSWALDVFVPGEAVPKGSTKAFAISAPNTRRGMRAVVTADNGPDQKAWGSAVRDAVLGAWVDSAPSWDAAVVAVEFVQPRRKGTPKIRRTPWHTRKPDADKLTRMVGDCLTHIVLADDAQVVSWQTHKREAEIDEAPGARIRVAFLPVRTTPSTTNGHRS